MYNMFIGSNIMEHLGIDLKYSTNTIQWGYSWATMQNLRPLQDASTNSKNDCVSEEVYLQYNDIDKPNDSSHVKDASKRTQRILDAKY